jgi:hypothetical protein
MLGNRLLQVVGVAVLGLRAGCPAGEAGEDGPGDLGVRGLQVDEGLLGRCLLLGVLAEAVPVHRVGDRGQSDVVHGEQGEDLCGVFLKDCASGRW